jgi:hypothetical protein
MIIPGLRPGTRTAGAASVASVHLDVGEPRSRGIRPEATGTKEEAS